MNNLKELRAQLKIIEFKLTTKTLSWGKHATYKDMDNNPLPSIFTIESKIKWQPLLDFVILNNDSLKNISKTENIIGLTA